MRMLKGGDWYHDLLTVVVAVRPDDAHRGSVAVYLE
ncbi:hypothetical protein PR003_g14173 [Phytophthora rubi]|uniref:Uncharacterized protein n=1 Tax=Phytophthora rubi TaxID=129364 RepID=A0A6A4EVI7_9STRA|nr:hypothetical protein PF003_g8818 [Phytophthora fragariae]KAE9333139.1 hypothetical protein PR003_g14173 [Phytophthora rubi]